MNRKTTALLTLAAIGYSLTTTQLAQGQSLTILHNFINQTDGGNPSGLIQAINGGLYGTSLTAGTSETTVLRITPRGNLTTLSATGPQSPHGGVIQATDGNFYGTAQFGGTGTACGDSGGGCGTVFKMSPTGSVSTLYSFCSLTNCTDGTFPEAGLIQAINGELYGTTNSGGANNCGTVFKLTLEGALTTLYSFCSKADKADGAYPVSDLIQAGNGDFYGTTQVGGAAGGGTIFRLNTSGELTTLHNFGGADGSGLVSGVIQGADGDFYGTAFEGGAHGDGTVFKMKPSGALTVLHSFAGADGANPFAALVQGTNGDFYGSTVNLGANGVGGTLFEITSGGALTTLYNFCTQPDCADGADPEAALTQDTDGLFYSTTEGGGSEGLGTVFSLSVGLGPFVETQTSSGRVGGAVRILGTDLTGATSVTFNGTSATFSVNSTGTAISATVPTGATSGLVQVVTPDGTLESSALYRVR